MIWSNISRRDVADELRLFSNRQNIPTEDDNRSFDQAMKAFRSHNPFNTEKRDDPDNLADLLN